MRSSSGFSDLAVLQRVVVGEQSLRHQVIAVDDQQVVSDRAGDEGLVLRQLARLGNPDLDDGMAARTKVAGCILKAGDLLVLVQNASDRVVDDVDQLIIRARGLVVAMLPTVAGKSRAGTAEWRTSIILGDTSMPERRTPR